MVMCALCVDTSNRPSTFTVSGCSQVGSQNGHSCLIRHQTCQALEGWISPAPEESIRPMVDRAITFGTTVLLGCEAEL